MDLVKIKYKNLFFSPDLNFRNIYKYINVAEWHRSICIMMDFAINSKLTTWLLSIVQPSFLIGLLPSPDGVWRGRSPNDLNTTLEDSSQIIR